MIAVLFEVKPRPGFESAYLASAARLRPALAPIDGFIDIERFRSLSEPDKLLSLSLWRDEDAVHRWRTVEAHRQAQEDGRTRLFAGYRLRVAEIVRDYGSTDRAEAPDHGGHLPGGGRASSEAKVDD